MRFRSHASVMAVCEFCRTGVVKDPAAVRELGKVAEVLEDYSPIQLGTSGTWGQRGFTVVGRLQLRYDAGMWNEWHILFDDGSSGWLADASGQYTVTTARDTPASLPAFETLRPGQEYQIGTERYTAADVRTAECVGGQGELPFIVGAGWQARVADLRQGTAFVTLDYSDGAAPQLYGGKAATLEGLKCQLLRDDDTILQTAGRYRGKLAALSCPSCGNAIQYLPGLTASLVCKACRAQLDAASPQAQVLQAGEKVKAVRTTLELGAEGKLGNQKITVIGVMRRMDDEGSTWTEYLLYGARGGFTWLEETDDGWFKSQVMDDWPRWQGEKAQLGSVRFEQQYDYRATVTFAAGAFNWRVQVGDATRIVEFERNGVHLAAELTAHELTWSKSTPVAHDQVQAWFDPKAKAKKAAPRTKGGNAPDRTYRDVAVMFIIGMLLINAIPLVFGFRATYLYTVLGSAAVYLPARFLDWLNERR
ncbi:DUF4178 domain-containing protein [Pseudoduganella buxea]|uniref:DUF4178 domain-containing protein n=1 Tax=Pseudoduganella buxea TaxID=1949069 RepID=UPI001E5E9CCE|nr:DUF4178 domain-containing protein [Pseudoduganella buxea]